VGFVKTKETFGFFWKIGELEIPKARILAVLISVPHP
jgi:hypothetical protein